MARYNFDTYCNEPAFPVPVTSEPDIDNLLHSQYQGISRLEYCTMQMAIAMPPNKKLSGAAREQELKNIVYFAEDLLYTLYQRNTERLNGDVSERS